MDLTAMGKKAKSASRQLAVASATVKNQALQAIAQALIQQTQTILQANARDLEAARNSGMKQSLQDRLLLDEQRIRGIADGVLQVAAQQDPIGEVLDGFTRPNGLQIRKIAVPLGVIGIIFEARPNVTVDAATLCLKSGNATILRGGKEAFYSNQALAEIMRGALEQSGLPADCIQLVQDTSRASSTALMQLNGYLDVLIPRGGAGLIQAVVQNATVPVIETGTGNCHIYIDESADLEMAARIVENAKTQRPSVCNACESLLVHSAVAAQALPKVQALLNRHHVEIRGCDRTKNILGDCVVPATEEDYATEFLDYIISVKVVDHLEQAIDHIMRYSSGHSECIVTNDLRSAEKFTANVDAAAVYVNASTRFTDGGEFGFGAEIGISTQKLHARGPMGLRQLTSVKYVVYGQGQIR